MAEPTAASIRLTVAAYYARAIGSEFVRNVAETFGTRIVLIGLTLVSSVIVARALGPEGRGLCAVAGAVGAIGVQLGNLGLHASNTYYVAKDRTLLPALVGNTLFVSFVVGGLGAVVVWFLFVLRPSLAPVHGVLLALALAWVPVGLAYLLLQNLLLGVSEVRAYNKIELLTKIIALSLIAVVIAAGAVTPETIFSTGLVALGISMGWALWQLARRLPQMPAVRLSLFVRALRYGLKSYAGCLFAFLVLRIDLVLVQYFLGAEQAGYYSIATNIADMLYMLPVVVGTLLFPKLSNMTDLRSKWDATKRVAGAVAALMLVTSLVMVLVAEPAVALLFGRPFLPAAPALVLLLPGVTCLAVSSVLSSYIASIDIPLSQVFIYGTAFLMNVALNVVLLPKYGIQMASVNSTITYAFSHLGLWILIWTRMHPSALHSGAGLRRPATGP